MSPDQQPTLVASVKDGAQGHDGTRDVAVVANEYNLELRIRGYGNCDMRNGRGTTAVLELWEDRLRLLVFADYSREEPTHTIDLEKAREPEEDGFVPDLLLVDEKRRALGSKVKQLHDLFSGNMTGKVPEPWWRQEVGILLKEIAAWPDEEAHPPKEEPG